MPEEFEGDLAGAVFWGADLHGARFRDVDLTGANSAPTFSDTLRFDLSTVVPCIAGHRRPQDRVALDDGKAAFPAALPSSIPPAPPASGVRPASAARPPGHPPKRRRHSRSQQVTRRRRAPVRAVSAPPTRRCNGVGGTKRRPAARRRRWSTVGAESFTLDHGHVVIAAITSCTNTSNPSVMLAAGLLAEKPWSAA